MIRCLYCDNHKGRGNLKGYMVCDGCGAQARYAAFYQRLFETDDIQLEWRSNGIRSQRWDAPVR